MANPRQGWPRTVRTAPWAADEGVVCYQIIRAILYDLHLVDDETALIEASDQVNHFIRSGYEELRQKALITDPVIEATLGVAFLSILPLSYVKRTKKGQLEHLKIQAALWKYERSRRSGGALQTSLTFEAARFAKILKIGIAAAYDQATKDEGDEPEDGSPDRSA
jgi:hypothetical protein